MPVFTQELVNRYIESAQPFVKSRADRLVLRRAVRPDFSEKTPSWDASSVDLHLAADDDGVKVLLLQRAVLSEIHAALCNKAARYRKHVAKIESGVDILIGAISLALAVEFGFAVAVVAALVASLLRIVVDMTVPVFCNYIKVGLLTRGAPL